MKTSVRESTDVRVSFATTRRTIAVSLGLSLFVTFVVQVFGTSFAMQASLTESFHWNYVRNLAYSILEVLPNPIFDSVTILVTLHVLRRISARAGISALGWITIDMVAAVVLALGVLIVMDFTTAIVSEALGPAAMIRFLVGGLCYVWAADSGCAVEDGVYVLAYSATTLVPTLLFLFVLALSVIGKPIAEGGRLVAVTILGAAKDHPRDQLPVFAMAAALIATIWSATICLERLFAA